MNIYQQIIALARKKWNDKASPYICDCLDYAATELSDDSDDPSNEWVITCTQLVNFVDERIEGKKAVPVYLGLTTEKEWYNHRDHPLAVEFREKLWDDLEKAFAIVLTKE